MHTDIQPFLEDAFSTLTPTSNQIGRVVVEPDYEADAAGLSEQLKACIADQRIEAAGLASHDGLELKLAGDCSLLKKYIRRITLHADPVEGAWVEIAPPGNWI